ncbi:MAG: diadenylate cyclase [Methanoregulaceae archaeon]|nr:diadenylate cyclase [Methanoregulaceae archaeon]
MSSVLFIENSHAFHNVLLSSLARVPGIQVDRAFSPVNAVNKMTGRPYHLVVAGGRELVNCRVRDTAKTTGASLLYVDLTPVDISKNRQGYLRDATLVIENPESSTEYNLSGFRNRNDLYSAASGYITRYIREHFMSQEQKLENIELFSLLEGCQIGIAVFSGREIRKINQYLLTLLGYSKMTAMATELPGLFSSQAEYMEFSRTIFSGKKEAGWNCTVHHLAGRDGTRILCTIRVRRLDGFDPMKGHLMIVERKDLPDSERNRPGQVLPSEWVLSGSFEEAIARVPGIVITTDEEGTITHANPSALRVFGYQASEVIGRNLIGTIVPVNSRYAGEMIAMINDPVFCRDGATVHAFENTKKSGEKFWVAWKILPLVDSERKISGVLCLGEDITGKGGGNSRQIRADPWKYSVLEGTRVNEEVFDAVFHLCVEISRDGHEGHRIGTSFVIGDTNTVMSHSRECTINSFTGQDREKRLVTNPDNTEIIKGLAAMDGAFVIREDGFIEAAGRHFIIDNLKLKIPEGLGTRHSSVAGISQMTNAIGLVVSQSGGKISIMKDGLIRKSFVV